MNHAKTKDKLLYFESSFKHWTAPYHRLNVSNILFEQAQ